MKEAAGERGLDLETEDLLGFEFELCHWWAMILDKLLTSLSLLSRFLWLGRQSWVVKSLSFGKRQTKVWILVLSLINGEPWENSFISLCLSFLIWKMGTAVLPCMVIVRIKYNNICAMLSTLPQRESQYINYYINPCFPRIKYQKRRKRKCWETGGWAHQAWLDLGPRNLLRNIVQLCTEVPGWGGK